MQLTTNKTTFTTTPQQKPATHQHKVHPGDQTFVHPHSKPHKEQQQDQSYQHFNTPAKAKHVYMTRHPNYCEATNITCTKDIYSIYIPSAHKESTSITYSTSINEKFQLQQPFQTMHFKTISIQQQKSNLHKTFTVLQQILQPTHFRTITFQIQLQPTHFRTITLQIQHTSNLFRTSKLQILPTATHSKTIMPTPELLHKTISTASTGTRTLLHKTISTASTATRTLYTATICSYHNIYTLQPSQQCLSTANKTFQPKPTLTDKRITAERHTNEARRQKHRLLYLQIIFRDKHSM